MTIKYKKDEHGTIVINTDAVIEAADQGGPGWAGKRNTSSRVYVKNGEQFAVTVVVSGRSYTVCSGTAKAKTGKMCSVFVRVRAEADVKEPTKPVSTPEIL